MPQGFIGCYRKTHLFFEETLFFTPGDTGFHVWDIGPAKIGIMVCFDWYYPESARTLALKGADIIRHPSNLVLPNCPDSMPVRCLENRVFAVTCNRIGNEARGGKDQLTYIGNSEVVTPKARPGTARRVTKSSASWRSIPPKHAIRRRLITICSEIAAKRITDKFSLPLLSSCALRLATIAMFDMNIPLKAQLGKGIFLVASPNLRDPNFRQTVVLLCEHGAEGALGVVVNRPTAMSVSEALPQMPVLEGQRHVLFSGGPVQPNQVMLLYRLEQLPDNSHHVFDGVCLGGDMDLVDKILTTDHGREAFRAYVGYSGWGPGQLESEMKMAPGSPCLPIPPWYSKKIPLASGQRSSARWVRSISCTLICRSTLLSTSRSLGSPLQLSHRE